MQRRLAAILAADVVGYSRLMGDDEAGTLVALKTHLEALIEPKIAEHEGRIVKLMGDGILAEFASAVAAVQAAVEIQQAMGERSKDVPATRRIEFRVGINIGDIIVEGDDIYGDGVNIAARLEGLAEPGGICVARNVFNQVKGKIDTAFEDLGEKEVKNIAEPVRVYQVTSAVPGSASGSSAAPALPLPDKPSIAVLPFTNMSGDPEQEYFSDGITEDVITELSHFRSLFVIARNSAFTYKGRSVNVGDVGRELGVQYVVEGSVRKAGNRVRVTAQLVEAATGNHLWAERFDHELDDIFAVQDEVTRAIVAALPGRLDEAAVERAHHKPTENLSAYDYLLRGKWRRKMAGESDPEARALFEKAIEIDPRCAVAHAWMAWFHVYDVFRWGVVGDEAMSQAQAQIEQALAIEGNDAFIRAIASQLYLFQGRYDLAKSHSARALALNPNDPEAVFNMTFTLAYLGDPKAGIELVERTLRLDPHSPDLYLEGLFDAHYLARDYEKAIEAFMRWGDPPPHMYAELAACYAQLGRMEDASAAVAEFERLRSDDYDFAEVARFHGQICARPEDRENWLEGYRKAGLLD
jgi:TolB-like protein/Tfp pilus assembly protein PilF